MTISKLTKESSLHKGRLIKLESDITDIKDKIKVRSFRPSIKIDNLDVSIKKSIINPTFGNKIVLTDSTWQFVEIFLKNSKNEVATNYWKQAKNFFDATQMLDITAKPLTSYYCFLNATKALLSYHKVKFAVKHGVSGKAKDGRKILQNEIIRLKTDGVLSGLAIYLKEPIKPPQEEYTFKQILYNLEFIHRAFQLTYKGGYPELFIPVEKPRFVYDKKRSEGWLEMQLDQPYNTHTQHMLPGFGIDKYYRESPEIVRRNKTFLWKTSRGKPDSKSIDDFKKYYINYRKQFCYIYSPSDLWYLKRSDLTNNIINKSTLVLTYVAMHRLSEQSRYDPNSLEKLLSKSEGWLIAEFINKSIVQFIDMISSEITGDDFRLTGFRV